MRRDAWDFEFPGFFGAAGFGPRAWAFCWPEGRRHGRGRRRRRVFESGDVKFVILRLLKEKPRHGYEIIKALEEKLGGWYSPSPGTVYPTLQLLEDQGLVRIVETEGKKVYHLTPEGERFLEENRSTLEEILERVREVVGGFAGGSMGELNEAVAKLARSAYRRAWKERDDERVRRIVDILRRAGEEIEAA